MFKILSSKYIKIEKTQWDLINNLFSKKNSEIEKLKKELSVSSTNIELNKLRKYKQNDDLLYNIEEYNKQLLRENNSLNYKNKELELEVLKLRQTVSNLRELESLYTRKIIELKQVQCLVYETKDIISLGIYV